VNNHEKSVGWMFTGTLVVVLAWLSLSPNRAQGQGLNAVYGSSNSKVSSLAFVDASQFTQYGDICQALEQILSTYHQGAVTGIVVDARGFPLPKGKQTYPCSLDPWPTYSSGPGSNTVLLPAGTIVLNSGVKWILSNNTRIAGEGPNLTVVQAGSGFSGEMIDMGNQSTCPASTGNPTTWDCQGVVIEHLRVDGGGNTSVSGIFNRFSEELSRVDDVELTNIAGVGISLGMNTSGATVTNSAGNSGPYSNISFYGNGICVQDTVGGRGIHRLSCNMTGAASCGGSSPTAAICLDGQNNTLEDVAITMAGGAPQSFPDGILIGSQGSAQNNILTNVHGINLRNVIHISNQSASGQGNCPVNACDITAMGISNSGGSSATIKDDLTATTLTDTNIAMYVLGDQTLNNGYSRFTTSPNAQTWLIGTGKPSGPCTAGTLYSCTSSCSNGTIFACTGGTSWTKIE